FSVNGSFGSFSTDLPSSGTYYLVFAHGVGSEESAQDVRVSYRVAGIEPEFIGVGLGLIAPGIILVGVGLWIRERRRKRAPAQKCERSSANARTNLIVHIPQYLCSRRCDNSIP